ncbi:MAG: tRNA guanosine(34) transglycosylase Tgt [Candidatus Berkelbacteria bacterium]|nr:tRNA guanosine(34) transglycosylase Tgt [Candidatus Berkelbacteria bacterium]
MFNFKILKKNGKSKARAGVITTPHGIVETPAFIPVGTQATVKGLTPQDLREIGVQILFGNTYHLHLRPGEDIVEDFGGVGKFMAWNGVTITDSGGFQVFSLGRPGLTQIKKKINTDISENLFSDPRESSPVLVKITDEGVKFRSHIDGSLHMFTPEESIRIQHKLGADIILAFDECAPHPSTHEHTKQAMERTHRWSERCLEYHQKNSKLKTQIANLNRKSQNLSSETYNSELITHNLSQQALYGIIQGGVYDDLRKESAKFISVLPFDGIAIGGVAVGENKKEMRKAVDAVAAYLPDDKPRHLLGIGEVDDIFDAVERGMDTFDCVIPTRFGRYGVVMVGPKEEEVKGRFRLDMTKTKYAKSKEKLSADCSCFVCQTFTRGYLHHLFKAKELLAYRLVSYHNMHFTVNLVKKIRQSILDDGFGRLKNQWID